MRYRDISHSFILEKNMIFKKHFCKKCKFCNIGLEYSECTRESKSYIFLTEELNSKNCTVALEANEESDCIIDYSWEDQKRFEDTGARILAQLSYNGKCQINDYGDTIDKDGNITYWTR